MKSPADKADSPFAFEKVYAHPGDIRTYDTPGRRKRICVIGGGIAGLTSAYELTQCDHTVVVLERTQRPGGRIRTARFADGSHGELGAMRIPANHKATLHYVETFGLRTAPFINANPAAKYCIRGEAAPRSDWLALAERFDLEPNERVNPHVLYEKLMQKAMAMLSTEEKNRLFAGDFSSGQVKAYDSQTLWQFLRRWLSPEAVAYVGHATGMIWYERASFLEALVDYFGLFRIDSVQLADGMDSLPAAFAAHLGESMHYGARVSRVEIIERGVRVWWRSEEEGGVKSGDFDYAVCALPVAAASALEFTPALPPRQLAALNGVTYASGAKALLHCRTRPWEYVDGIYGGGSFTDLGIQQCWYPADNARGISTEVATAFTGDDPEVQGGNYSQAPAEWTAKSAARSHGPGVLTGAYMWEANAHRFAALSSADRDDLVVSCLEKLHPELPAEIEAIEHVIWDAEAGGGTYAFYGPGDYQRFHGVLRQPFPHEDPRVFFSGEHLGVSHAWIQGAVRSGWDAARYIVGIGSEPASAFCPATRDGEMAA